MPSQKKLDHLFMDIAQRIAQMSHATRAKVGSIIVKDDNIISMGWNGTPAGMDNACEVKQDGALVTSQTVLHSESNSLMKLTSTGGGSAGATLYTTMSPCPECAKLIKQAKIARVVYKTKYRLLDGIEMLDKLGVNVEQLNETIEHQD